MSSLNLSVGMNIAGCASGPHEENSTPAERASMQRYRLSSCTQPRDEHVIDRLVHRLPLKDHTQRIKSQVKEISSILPTSSNTNPNNGS
ncbi:hypothetical protein F5B21DRAFT_457878 [Xylaria acuta]|nr:hypothetical protein F5B21DRAFT_457878 [Xylaria acuta]